jgi:hypothetical protein
MLKMKLFLAFKPEVTSRFTAFQLKHPTKIERFEGEEFGT